MMIIRDRLGHERAVPDDYRLQPGETCSFVRVSALMMDSLQKAVSSRSPFLRDERALAFGEMVEDMVHGWRREPVVAALKEETVPAPVTGDTREAAYAAMVADMRDGWRRRQPVVAAVAPSVPTASAVPVVGAQEDARAQAWREMVADMENAWQRREAA